MKTSFILHLDSLAVLDKLTNEQAGQLFKAIHSFQKTGELPPLDFILEIAITPFINQFLRDKIKYEETSEERRLAGSLGGKKRAENAQKRLKKKGLQANEANATISSKTKQNQANVANQADSDSDSEKDSDSVTSKEVIGSRGADAPPQPKTFKQWSETEFYNEIGKYKPSYSKETLRAFYDYWREKNGRGKMRFQLEQTWQTDLRLATWQRREDEKKITPIKHISEAQTGLSAYIKKIN